jgi:hypothetical protein
MTGPAVADGPSMVPIVRRPGPRQRPHLGPTSAPTPAARLDRDGTSAIDGSFTGALSSTCPLRLSRVPRAPDASRR